MRMFRHGDVVLVEAKVPDGARRVEPARRVVLAEGEVTGHAHVIEHQAGAVELWELEPAEPVTRDTARMFLRVLEEAGVELTHEEHATLTIPPGEWEVRRQREWSDEDEPRQVAD